MTLVRPLSSALALAVVLASPPLSAQSGADVAGAYRESHEPAIVRDFAELLSYPTRAFTEDIVRAAEYIRDDLIFFFDGEEEAGSTNLTDMATRRRYPRIAKVTGGGGSLAARTTMSDPFTELLRKPAIIVPTANHDNNQHAPDANPRIANLWYAIDLYAGLLTMPLTVF